MLVIWRPVPRPPDLQPASWNPRRVDGSTRRTSGIQTQEEPVFPSESEGRRPLTQPFRAAQTAPDWTRPTHSGRPSAPLDLRRRPSPAQPGWRLTERRVPRGPVEWTHEVNRRVDICPSLCARLGTPRAVGSWSSLVERIGEQTDMRKPAGFGRTLHRHWA